MTGSTAILVVLSLAVTAVTIGWFFATQRHPERASSHEPADRSTGRSDVLRDADPPSPDRGDRPAGPDAETMNPELLGGDHRPPPVHD
jgi:hypothetical protein